MTTYYKATAEDGTEFTRSTAERVYTHCIAVLYTPYKETESRWIGNSWAGRPDLAEREASRLRKHHRVVAVLPVVEITRQENRTIVATEKALRAARMAEKTAAA